jgi:hypothetical protein
MQARVSVSMCVPLHTCVYVNAGQRVHTYLLKRACVCVCVCLRVRLCVFPAALRGSMIKANSMNLPPTA